MTDETQATRLLQWIVAAYTAGDADRLDALILEAAELLSDDGPEPTAEEAAPPLVPDRREEEVKTSITEDQTAAPAAIVDPKGQRGNQVADAHAALVGLYNAVKRLNSQGSNPSTIAELDRALKNAERFV